ncbi:MAG: hypothetical protein H6Q73_1093 [Firmicutes bacterium]|nr:hypothetical protein [Bacillota bacterium]
MRMSPRRPYTKRHQNENFGEFKRGNESETEGYQQERGTTIDNSNDDDRVITDMAKGFALAQAKINNTSDDLADREMMQLLQNINRQLESLSKKESGNSSGKENATMATMNQNASSVQNTGQSSASNTASGNNSSGPIGEQPDDKLRVLFSNLFQENNNNNNSGNSSKQPVNKSNSNMPSDSNISNKSSNSSNSSGTLAQTAAQVLSQAQYELSEELRSSLNKLKQVIDESEKIANRISMILEEENNQEQS